MKKKLTKKSMPESLKRLVEDKEAYEQYYNEGSTRAIRKLIAEELRNRIEIAVIKSENLERYEGGNWAEYQSDSIGYRRALREIIRLLDSNL